jgi:hypothetical protein
MPTLRDLSEPSTSFAEVFNKAKLDLGATSQLAEVFNKAKLDLGATSQLAEVFNKAKLDLGATTPVVPVRAPQDQSGTITPARQGTDSSARTVEAAALFLLIASWIVTTLASYEDEAAARASGVALSYAALILLLCSGRRH